jgi:hypothetical protein
MNPEVHAQISVKRWGGHVDDYYPIHFLMDSTKELCSDNRHRILHTLWGVRRVVIPIFGITITNADQKVVKVKDICEFDHILPDYNNRFIPTLADFVRTIDVDSVPSWQARIEALHQQYQDDAQVRELLLSPLSVTGMLPSLLLTHNSWFLNEIVPKVLGRQPRLTGFEIAPSDFFEQMSFELWMDNGSDIPPSARKLEAIRLS